MRFVIPSHKRADRVLSKKLVIDPIICVAESQREQYEHFNPECEIVCHPDDVVGLIPKRNWMAKHFGDIFMFDDDVTGGKKLFVEKGESAVLKDPAEITRIITELHELAELLDIHVYGFTSRTTPLMYEEDRWYSLNSMITGCSYGVRYKEGVTWWNEDLKLKEDFWISCFAKYKERKVLTDLRYSFSQKGTFVSSGGLAAIRNQEEEKRSMLIIKKHFGDSIQIKKPGTNGKDKTQSKVQSNISVKFRY